MRPYQKLLLLVLFLSQFTAVFAQNKSDTTKINFIKSQYAEINKNLKSYKKVIKTDTTETTEGNDVTLYFNGKEIKKIAGNYFGETGKNHKEFYFYNKKLIFYYFVEYRYTVPISVDGSKIASKKEKRYYFEDGNLFLIKGDNIKKAALSDMTITTRKEAERLINFKSSDEN